VNSWIELEYLKEGDYLIVDNAAVHAAEAINDDLKMICSDAGINLRFFIIVLI